MDADPLYRQLAAHYRQAISAGTLAPGSRMPSVRALMGMHRVSLSTALQACRLLESQGLLQARQRAGYFVQRARASLARAEEPAPRTPDPARFVGVHQRISRYLERAHGQTVRVNLSGACAAPALYPLDALRLAATRALRSQPELLGTPAPAQGMPVFRAALARLALSQQIALQPEEVLVTHGCTEALNLALRAVTQPGDVVAVESPTYHGLLQILESLNLRALEIPTSPHTGLSLPDLQAAAAQAGPIKAVVVVPNLQNPLGAVMPDPAKQALLAWCEAQDLALIEDDTYTALFDGPAPLRAIKSWDRPGAEGRVIFCGSLHKILAPGMRLGYISGGRWQPRLAMLKYSQSRANEVLGQLAAAAFMANGQMERHLRRLRTRLGTQREQMAEALARHLPPGTRLSLPPGGVNLWVQLPEGVSSDAVFVDAMAEGIRLAPGAIFSNSARYDNYLRINCGLPFEADVQAAVATLGRIVTARS